MSAATESHISRAPQATFKTASQVWSECARVDGKDGDPVAPRRLRASGAR
jgi:hypothetical protein